uniref:Hflx-type G domain-containing protein n=1 Tax=Brassica oleracea TaxID=3712 RepID=A0A3P6FWJ8_BRAOL|nr:unnamed protein product [Brassica oleracea]
MLRTLSLARDRLRSNAQVTSSPSTIRVLSSPFSLKRHAPKATEEEAPGLKESVLLYPKDPSSTPKLFLVQPRLTPPKFLQAKLNEALCLANSLEEQRYGYFESDFFDKELPSHVVVQNPIARSSKPRVDTYFGRGTLNISIEEVDAVFINAILSAIQQRNLERIWGKPVLDRVGLIIEIFNAHAHTKEAKLQAELAALMYKKSRLVRVRGTDGRQTFGQFGEAEVVSARGRAASKGTGFVGGAGETELQLQRRRISDRRLRLLSQIKEAQRTRLLQRAARKRQSGLEGKSLATIAVVGYTNAGKSTLTSALTRTALYCNERLFATLDPTLKNAILPSGRKVLFSDTVGFISDLPIQLVEAFQSTLEEVVEADLLLHVVDSTAPNIEEHRSTVFHVLNQIGVPEEKLKNMIEVWNKIDYEEEEEDMHYLDDGKGEEVEAELSEDSIAEETSEASSEATVDEDQIQNQEDDSDEWLLSEDENVSDSELWKVPEEAKVDAAQKTGPDVRVSALTGVGLKELMYLIDEKLSGEDEKRKSETIVERNDFQSRKWRPSFKDEEFASEQ